MLRRDKFINTISGNRLRRAISGLFSVYEDYNVPPAGALGYPPGARFNLINAELGQAMTWINQGTTGSAKFVPVGPVFGYGVSVAGGPVTSESGSTSQSISLQGLVIDSDVAIVGHEVSNDDDQIVAAITDEGSIDITADADPSTAHGYVYAALRDECVPGWDIVAAGTHTTTGDAAAEAITVSGVLATDIAFANYSATDNTDTISDVVCTADTVTVTCSADPGTTHGLHYAVLRPRGSFRPSHYIAYAGTVDTTSGAAVAVTITGAKATDIPIVIYSETDDTDNILKVEMAEDTMTVTCSDDPGTTHAFAYMILREY